MSIERSVEALRMSCLTAESVEVDQLVVRTRDLRAIITEYDRLLDERTDQ